MHESTGTRTPALELRGWTKDFGGGRGILDLDLRVHQGEVFGFIGPNGAGKTTTLRSVLGLLRPTGGVARVLGVDPIKHGEKIRHAVGYLPGDLSLWEDRTGAQFLADVARLRGGVVDENDVDADGNRLPGVDRTYRDSLVKRLGVDMETKIRRLSKGNKQKLGIVQAFMHQPALLLLDEPTDGLDPLLRRQVHEMILEVRARGGTVFLSSHVIHEVARVCDRLALVSRGRLLMCEHVATLRQGLSEELFVTFAEPVTPDDLRGIEGVERVQTKDPRSYRFLVKGSPDALLKRLARFEVAAMRTRAQDLEDALLYLYEGEA